jgi:hypothetical protein
VAGGGLRGGGWGWGWGWVRAYLRACTLVREGKAACYCFNVEGIVTGLVRVGDVLTQVPGAGLRLAVGDCPVQTPGWQRLAAGVV